MTAQITTHRKYNSRKSKLDRFR